MINRLFNNKLVLAPTTFKSGDVVLDSGTGSGATDFAKEHDCGAYAPASIHFHGIDIVDRMFPSPSIIPPNMTFTTCSITSLPPEWSNTISLVHQRLLLGALQSSQWKAALAEIHRVVVPGGWVQIMEPNQHYISPSSAIRNHKEFQIRHKLCFEAREIVLDAVDRLPKWLEEAGFVNLQIEKKLMPIGSWAGEPGALALRNIGDFWRAVRGLVLKENGFGVVRNEVEFDAVVDDLIRLCEETPETYMEYWVFIVQKPVV